MDLSLGRCAKSGGVQSFSLLASCFLVGITQMARKKAVEQDGEGSGGKYQPKPELVQLGRFLRSIIDESEFAGNVSAWCKRYGINNPSLNGYLDAKTGITHIWAHPLVEALRESDRQSRGDKARPITVDYLFSLIGAKRSKPLTEKSPDLDKVTEAIVMLGKLSPVERSMVWPEVFVGPDDARWILDGLRRLSPVERSTIWPQIFELATVDIRSTSATTNRLAEDIDQAMKMLGVSTSADFARSILDKKGMAAHHPSYKLLLDGLNYIAAHGHWPPTNDLCCAEALEGLVYVIPPDLQFPTTLELFAHYSGALGDRLHAQSSDLAAPFPTESLDTESKSR